MKAIMMMFDSLNRQMLSPYGCTWTKTPNFQRLAERTVKFENHYAGSLPCIPARRELHTGRYNFLHRSWGPLEPFDDSVPELLKNNGIHSHLVSDHCHYWEDGGATYHTRYSTWEIIRGQEGDPWKATPELIRGEGPIQNLDAQYFPGTNMQHKRDAANRQFMRAEADMPITRTFAAGLDFLDHNGKEDNWFLQIECFDPHEPFFSAERYQELYPHDYDGPHVDWPPYHHLTEDAKTAEHLKLQYASLLSMCDHNLGKLLDKMDELDLWKDTMLIVNTDHGYLLGEHGWWSKVVMPVYDEIAHTPLFIYDPRYGVQNETRQSLVQLIDIPATILDFFGLPLPKDMQGKPLGPVIAKDHPIRPYALFGIHGAHVNVTDGRYVYMKAPKDENDQPLNEYTLVPMHMRCRFSPQELQKMQLSQPLAFTKGCPVLRIPCANKNSTIDFSELLLDEKTETARHIDNNSLVNAANFGDMLYDLEKDPQQTTSIQDTVVEVRMANLLVQAMKENNCPVEQYERIGLPYDHPISEKDIEEIHRVSNGLLTPPFLEKRGWDRCALNTYRALMRFIPKQRLAEAEQEVRAWIEKTEGPVTGDLILSAIPNLIPPKHVPMVSYFVGLSGRVF